MQVRPYLIHALSPIHAGTGQSVEVIDLPIARMRSTGIPIIPGSSIKGSLRDTLSDTADKEHIDAIFGPDTDNASDHAGAAVFSDARLLALPVRSFLGTFAWVSSPLLLSLAKRDLDINIKLPPFTTKRSAYIGESSINQRKPKNKDKTADVYLEDINLKAQNRPEVDQWGELIASLIMDQQTKEAFKKRFVVVDDETMTFLWETATQVDARIRIDSTTKTVVDGALWYEESLPPETLLIGLLSARNSLRKDVDLSSQAILDTVLKTQRVVQFGGKGSVGRGRCRLLAAAQ